ncbi:trans-aconitate 2-methyltransferase [Streptomyces sp. NBC_00102]|uniref:class I SAM-dependent methyltransferase n=1 Tax=Streptomyces sp. NBC_00102 TaxID=2975652 RepID=UPI00224CBB4E|nr:methyltransferase domain-containing protein [Streptomyces sp. NBC_00102]MCX5401968.1 class I SAM-dependent methyltransferase [Streptomyces sp. NBC_00102]
MTQDHHVAPPPSPPDRFGAAHAYARHRPGVPREVAGFLAAALAPVPRPVLLDLGTGTGQVPLAMLESMSPAHVSVVDTSGERTRAALGALLPELGASRVTGFTGRAEDFGPVAPDRRPHLITCCRAFHWMDRPAVLAMADRVAAPRAVFVVMGDGSLWTHGADWTRALRGLIQSYLGPVRRAGTTGVYAEPSRSFDEDLAASAFGRVSVHEFPVTRVWTPEGVLGHLATTSYAGPALFGDRHAAFEEDARRLLGTHAALGPLTEESVFTVRLARRPGDLA